MLRVIYDLYVKNFIYRFNFKITLYKIIILYERKIVIFDFIIIVFLLKVH
jgi:hypothetical protein